MAFSQLKNWQVLFSRVIGQTPAAFAIALRVSNLKSFRVSIAANQQGSLRQRVIPCCQQQRVLNNSSITDLSMTRRTRFREAYGPWAVVTGASSGIGAEFARQLAAHGLDIALVARREDRLQMLSDTLKRSANVQTQIIVADLSTFAGVDTVCSMTEEMDVGLLINNAGVAYSGSLVDLDLDKVRNLMAVNSSAVAQLAYIFGARMCKQGRGGILFVSSMSAFGMPLAALYSSSKAFVTCFALALGPELSRAGVDCMALEPGFVNSEMTLGTDEQDDPSKYPGIIPTDQCVREALSVFGSKAVYTPGFTNRLFKNFILALPRSWAMWLLYKTVGRFNEEL